MSFRPFTFLILHYCLSVISTVFVVGFTSPRLYPSNGFNSSFRATATILRYVADTNYNGGQYHRSRIPDVKVVDNEAEGNSQYVYIPLYEVEEAVKKAQENHEQDCASMQNVINEQREELKRLKERNQMSDSADTIKYDHHAEIMEVNWNINHEEKMKRTTDRVRFLTNENERLHAEFGGERNLFELENGRLQQKWEEARDETIEAQQILSLERSYFETAMKLLEVGLERETKNVKALEDQLLERNELGYHGNRHQPFHDNHPPYETWEALEAYEQCSEHNNHEFNHSPHHREEIFEEFRPRVRPQEGGPCYPQHTHIHSQHEVIFQAQEAQSFHRHHDGQTTQAHSYARSNANIGTRRPATVTTTPMGSSDVRNNLEINDIRDRLYH